MECEIQRSYGEAIQKTSNILLLLFSNNILKRQLFEIICSLCVYNYTCSGERTKKIQNQIEFNKQIIY